MRKILLKQLPYFFDTCAEQFDVPKDFYDYLSGRTDECGFCDSRRFCVNTCRFFTKKQNERVLEGVSALERKGVLTYERALYFPCDARYGVNSPFPFDSVSFDGGAMIYVRLDKRICHKDVLTDMACLAKTLSLGFSLDAAEMENIEGEYSAHFDTDGSIYSKGEILLNPASLAFRTGVLSLMQLFVYQQWDAAESMGLDILVAD